MKHLLLQGDLSMSPAVKTLLIQVAGQLETLELEGYTSWIQNLLNSCPKFSNLKLLFIADEKFDLQYLNKFPEVEILFNLIFGSSEEAIKLSKLKTLVVMSLNPWSREMIELNSGKNIP